jgi:hypothetical protein
VDRNTYGIFANGSRSTGTLSAHVRDSVVAYNMFHGITAYSTPGQSTTSVTVDRTSSLLNLAGVRAQGTPSFVTVGNSTIMSNIGGLSTDAGGHIVSYQNNQIIGNLADGSPTSVATPR